MADKCTTCSARDPISHTQSRIICITISLQDQSLASVVHDSEIAGLVEISKRSFFAKEFDDIGRKDLANVRRGGGLRAIEMSVSVAPFYRGDFEVLFVGARRFVDGNEPSSWEECKSLYQNKACVLLSIRWILLNAI